MREIVLSVAQIRRWTNPSPYLTGGYSNTQDVLYVHENSRRVQLPAGGWTLSAADLLVIEWDGPLDRECMYRIFHNQQRVNHGLWTPTRGETVTETFFRDEDLWILHYRLLKVVET